MIRTARMGLTTVGIVTTSVAAGITGLLDAVAVAFLFVVPGTSLIYPSYWFQYPFGVWFGVWGVMGTYIGTVLAGLITGSSLVASVIFKFSDLINAAVPAFMFRFFRLDPTLSTRKAALAAWLVSGVTAIPSALFAVAGMYYLGWIPADAMPIMTIFWLQSMWTYDALMIVLVMRYASPIVVKSRLYCKGWWA